MLKTLDDGPVVQSLAASDVDTVSTLADRIWRQHYASIISQQQIDYMLSQRYRPELITAQLSNPDIGWRKLVLGQAIIGFSCCLRIHRSDELKIDKLYIHCDHHRKGYGALLVADAVELIRGYRLQSLFLTVNKDNHTAITAYRCYGFEITEDSVVDIGGGFIMNDYRMTLTRWDRWNK